MTTPDRGLRSTAATTWALACLTTLGGVLSAAPAAADPDPVVPGQPVLSADGAPAAPAPPPLAPSVPEIANPVYGSGRFGSGPLGTIRDLWYQARNPGMADDPAASVPGVAPPPGAGPAPALPPGYVSVNAPGSETASTSAPPNSGGPSLPPGYYSITGPPPPGYEFTSPGAASGPAAPALPESSAPTP